MAKNRLLRDIRNTLGLTRRIIQGYEEKGLIKPSGKDKYGRLLYDEDTIKRMAYVRFYQNLGYKLNEISEMIDGPEDEIKKLLINKKAMIKNQIQYLINEHNIIDSYLSDNDKKRYREAMLNIIKNERKT